LIFGSRLRRRGRGQDHAEAQAISEELLGHAGGDPVARTPDDGFESRQERSCTSARVQEKPYHFLLNLSNQLDGISGAGSASTGTR
jgi:hypothetical protein